MEHARRRFLVTTLSALGTVRTVPGALWAVETAQEMDLGDLVGKRFHTDGRSERGNVLPKET